MGIFTKKVKIEAHPADINPAPKSTIKRRVMRAARVKEAYVRAVDRGDHAKAQVLEAEFNVLTAGLEEEREAINEMLGGS